MSYESWKRYIDAKDNEKRLNEIRRHTLTGRPLGSVSFIERLEKRFGRRLSSLARGRPRKKQK